MIDLIGTIDNFETLPSPVLDATQPKGWRLEQRLQLSLKAASNEKQYTVEFRLGEDSQTPSEQQLNSWLESGELVQALCTGLSARPFVHQQDKTYRSKGKEVQINGETAELDAFVVFAGFAVAPLAGGLQIEDAVKQARGAFKRSQRAFRAQRNAERAAQMEAQMEARAQQMWS